jgi:uncharacterized membrane protein YkvA (DUF1232 family)
VQIERDSRVDGERRSRFSRGDDARGRPRVRLDAVTPEDEAWVREAFWPAFRAARPSLGRLSGLREFAVNLVRLFEMLVEPGFKLPWRTTAAIVFALAYFVSSVDLVPDAIPVLGLLDDAFVVAEVVVMVASDLARFEATRRRPKAAVRAPAQAA